MKGKSKLIKLRLGEDHLAVIDTLSRVSGERQGAVVRVLLAVGILRFSEESRRKKAPSKRG